MNIYDFNQAMVSILYKYKGHPELMDQLNKVSQTEPALNSLYVLPPEASAEGVNQNIVSKFSTFDDAFNHYFRMFDEAFDDALFFDK